MSRIQVSKNFYLDEFIYPEAYHKHGELSKGMVDNRLFAVAQFIRDSVGVPVTINNWFTGGQYKESGLRDVKTKTGSPKSAHKQGLAIDIKVQGMNGLQMYEWAIRNARALYDLGVRRIEDPSLTPTWLHIDLKGPAEQGNIALIDLKKVVTRISV